MVAMWIRSIILVTLTRKQSATERPFLCAYSHLEVGYWSRKVKIVTQNVKCGDEVTPLDELPEGSTTEGRICYFKPRFNCQSPRMHQDLGDDMSFFTLRSQAAPFIWPKKKKDTSKCYSVFQCSMAIVQILFWVGKDKAGTCDDSRWLVFYKDDIKYPSTVKKQQKKLGMGLQQWCGLDLTLS